MKYITHELKGTFSYVKKQTVFEILKTLLLFAMALGIFFIGYFTLGTKKSLWSIFAVLAILPASKSLVSAIMFLRYRSISAEIYNKLSDAAGVIPTLYENILTTNEKTYFLPAISYAKGSVIAYAAGGKDNAEPDKKSLEKITAHLQTVLKTGGHKDLSVKVFANFDDYILRVREMNENFSDEKLNADPVFSTIKAVSL